MSGLVFDFGYHNNILVLWCKNLANRHTDTYNRFTALWTWSGTTRVSCYQKKHSPTNTYHGDKSSLICFYYYYYYYYYTTIPFYGPLNCVRDYPGKPVPER